MAAAPFPQAAAAAARSARQDLGLSLQGALTDVVALVEGPGGVPTTIAELPANLSGAFLRVRSRPFILLNGNEPAARQRFTLAHEFGHFRLGHGEVVDGPGSFTSPGMPDEVAANQFAAEFLAPLQAVHAWMEASDNPAVDLTIVVRFAVDFGVSAHVARYRFADARYLTPRQAREIDDSLKASRHREIPLLLGLIERQDTITEAQKALPRVPRQLQENAFRGYANGLLGLDRLAQLLRRDSDAVAADLAKHGVKQVPPDQGADW